MYTLKISELLLSHNRTGVATLIVFNRKLRVKSLPLDKKAIYCITQTEGKYLDVGQEQNQELLFVKHGLL